jgi:hypothetical protein
MIEYLYDAIRASAGSDLAIAANITDKEGNPITENCNLYIHSDEEHLITAEAKYEEEQWLFSIPATATKNLRGRYWYCICQAENDLCFKQPIYFV